VTNAVSTFRVDDARPVSGELINQRIADVEALARWMDYAFVLPGGFRFGLAGIIGFLPGIGDIMDALISLYIVNRALQLRIPRVGVARMVLNVGIEGLLGAVPFVGDLFDVVFKANRRNYLLLNSYLAQPRRQRGMDWLFLLATLLIVIVAVALPIWLLSLLIRHLV
jgi:hypothetical protein